MNDTTPDTPSDLSADASTPAPADPAAETAARPPRPPKASKPQQRNKAGARPPHPTLQALFELYPMLFGARFLPLKLGVFEDLATAHPDRLPREELKVALGLHTRSNRYLEAVASGLPRHDLQGNAIDPIAPEHVHHAILELYRRKSTTPQEPAARIRAVAQLVAAIESSGMDRDVYRERFGAGQEFGRLLLEEALGVLGQQAARQEALQRAYQASGATVEAFAQMYGLAPREVQRLVKP